MPKMKTHRGAAKRFKVTASGEVKRHKGFTSHLLTSKSAKRMRSLKKGTMVAKCDRDNIKKLIPYS